MTPSRLVLCDVEVGSLDAPGRMTAVLARNPGRRGNGRHRLCPPGHGIDSMKFFRVEGGTLITAKEEGPVFPGSTAIDPPN